MKRIIVINQHCRDQLQKFQLNFRMHTLTTVQNSKYTQQQTNKEVVNFGIGQPSPSLLSLEPMEKAAKVAFSNTSDPFVLQYGTLQGFSGFRKTLADFLSEKYQDQVNENELFITNGNSHAISLLSLLLTKDQPTSNIIVEDPSYFLAFDIFKEQGLTVHSIPTDQDGMMVDQLEFMIKNQGICPKLVYTIPTYHNPTGTTLSKERRSRLIQLAYQYDFFILADEPYCLLHYEETLVPPFTLMDNKNATGRVVSLGTFSKIFAPGLRLGWIHASSSFIEILSQSAVARSGGGFNPVVSALMHHEGKLQNHLEELRHVYSERKQRLCAALRKYLPSVQFYEPKGGYFIWLQLNINCCDDLVLVAKKYGVAFTSGTRCSLLQSQKNCLRICFAFYNSDELEEGVRRLKQAIDEYSRISFTKF